ncbi:MAG: hypothetical protein ACOYYJ_08275 [Chloroflexota bacterium]
MTAQENTKPGQNTPEGDSRSRLLSDLLSRAGLANNQRGLFLLMAFYGAAGLGACSFLDLDPGELPAGGEPTNTPPPTATNKPTATPTQPATETPTIAPTEISRTFVTINPPVEPYNKDTTVLEQAIEQATDPVQRRLLEMIVAEAESHSRNVDFPAFGVSLFEAYPDRDAAMQLWADFLSASGEEKKKLMKDVLAYLDCGPIPPGVFLSFLDEEQAKNGQPGRYNILDYLNGRDIVVDRTLLDFLDKIGGTMLLIDRRDPMYKHVAVINPNDLVLSNPPDFDHPEIIEVNGEQSLGFVGPAGSRGHGSSDFIGDLFVRIYSFNTFGEQTEYNVRRFLGYYPVSRESWYENAEKAKKKDRSSDGYPDRILY